MHHLVALLINVHTITKGTQMLAARCYMCNHLTLKTRPSPHMVNSGTWLAIHSYESALKSSGMNCCHAACKFNS